MITSTDNPKIKLARVLMGRRGRQKHQQCLAEGMRLIEDVMRAGILPALLFYLAPAQQMPRVQNLLRAAKAANVPLWEVSLAVFGTFSDTMTSQGLIAVLPIPEIVAPVDPSLILVLDHVRDPGNLGTILRSAEAAGADLVLLAAGCVDPWGPKVLRAGMGAHFRLAIRSAMAWPQISQLLAGRPLWLADARGVIIHDRVDWTGPCALAVGGETEEFSAEAIRLSASRVTIPMSGGAESLNAAMAATILLFEAARQRRMASPPT